jgi:ribosomal protein S18 acetylase RimI-like enzyme
MDITFRNAEQGDNNFIVALIEKNLRDVIDVSFNGFMNYTLFFERISKEGMASIVFVDGVPCGFLWCSAKGKCLHINTIVIDSEYQCKGIGSKIFDGLELMAKSLNLTFLDLGVQGVNIRAQKFYERRGFIKYKYEKQVDTYYMQKKL